MTFQYMFNLNLINRNSYDEAMYDRDTEIMRVGILSTARLCFTTLALTLCNKVEVTQFCNYSSSSLLAYTMHPML